MQLDDFLILADRVTTTTSAASTDYIDTKAAGDAYESCFFVVKTDTIAFTAGAGAPAVVFQLQTSPATNFTDSGTATLLQSSTLYAANLTASKVVFVARIPNGCKRYLRGYYSITNYSANTIYFSAASYDMFITKDPYYANWIA